PLPAAFYTLSLHDALPIFVSATIFAQAALLVAQSTASPFVHTWFAPVGTDALAKDSAANPPVIVGVGRLTAQKDFAMLLRAFTLDRKSTRLNSSHVSISYA